MATPLADSVANSGDPLRDGLLQGGSWSFSGSRVLTYSFNTNFDIDANGQAIAAPGGDWTEPLMAAFERALTAWSNVADLQFQKVTSGNYVFESTADIAAALTGSDLFNSNGAVALGFFPDPGYVTSFLADTGYTRAQYPRAEGDVLFDNFYGGFAHLGDGGFGFWAMLHELGHALGLKHPFDGTNGAPTIGEPYDNERYTVMSYSGATNSTASGHAATPMPLDIQAIQHIYGANMTYHTGDDTYTVAADGVMRTIWDAGGNDTLDASGLSVNLTLDLRPGAVMDLGGGGMLGVAYNCSIENLIGGSGNDTLYGNAAANVLSGGAGNDVYVVDAGDSVVETPNGGTWDFIVAYADHTLEANVEAMIMQAGSNGTGNSAVNALYGDSDPAANVLTGLDGSDIYNVGAGDVVVEAAGAAAGSWDFINAYVSRTLELNVEAMIMLNGSNGTGNSQDNALYGNYDAAANVLTGMDGNDVYLLGAGDTVVETPTGGSWDFMVSYVTHTMELNVEAMILDNGANGFGNAQDNALYGNFDPAANTLTGGDGNDVYNVGTGDVVVEAAGAAAGTWDFIFAFVNHTLEANVEAMIMFNGATGTGNAQANTLYGNWDLSANVLIGDDGDDTYVVLAGDTVQEAAGQGTDTVMSFVDFTLPTNVENLSLSGTDPVNGTGNSAANLILGNGSDNTISGKDGNDRLYGGAGSDRFVFDTAPNTATNVDVITDFTPGIDKLVLDHLIFTQLAVSNLAAGNLVVASGAFASQADNYLLYNSDFGNLFYDADGSGAGAPTWVAHLDNNPALTASDFSVI